MRVPPRAKQNFYSGLSQLLRSGIPFPTALEKILSATRGPICGLIARLRGAVLEGQSVGDAFHQQAPLISPMEASVIASLERSGKLEHGFQQLARYFEALALARELVFRKSAYPIFVLHLGIILMALPKLVQGGGSVYLHEIGPTLAIIYAGAIVVALLLPLFRDIGTDSPALDRLLRTIPLLGKVRSCFANARFCMIYGIELDAGVNVIDGLIAAGRASRSGLIQTAVTRALPDLRNGSQVGPLLARSRAFPEKLSRGILLGEDSGELDQDLERLAAEFQEEALTRLQSTAQAFCVMLYLAVVGYIGYSIITTFQGMLSDQAKLLDF